MSEWVWLVIAVDIIITLAVIVFFVRLRGNVQNPARTPGSPASIIGQFKDLMAFSKEHHERIGDYVRANWSGIPDQLPGVLGTLLDRLQDEAKAKGIALDRDMLKTMVATSLRHHKLGKADDVGNALERVA